MSETPSDLLTLTADIVSAHVANNQVESAGVAALIRSVHSALAGLGQTIKAPMLDPAVPIRSSVKPDYIVCLEDGAKLKMLKRYLRTRFDLTPEQYRTKWGLPKDYPMVSPNYAAKRQALAKETGLGRKSEAVAGDTVQAAHVAPKPRRGSAGRKAMAAGSAT